jgi:cleavage and polyadenylation specificity factor subunit 4
MPSVDVIDALFDSNVEFDFESILRMEDREMAAKAGNIPNARLPGGGLSRGMKTDFRRGTVVCTYWLKGLCMKGDECGYLHQMDTSRMPECKHGTECDDEDCPFRHVKEEDRIECVFYRQVKHNG